MASAFSTNGEAVWSHAKHAQFLCTVFFKTTIEKRFQKLMTVLERHSSKNSEIHELDSDDSCSSDAESETCSDDSSASEDMPTRLGRAVVEHIRLRRRYGRNETGQYKYMVQGATDRHYTIYIGPNGTQCTCPDGRRVNRCKDIYFVLMMELGVDENHPVLLKSEFTPRELAAL